MRKWIIPLSLLVCAILCLMLLGALVRALVDLTAAPSVGSARVSGDPMFAASPEPVTRPPSLVEETGGVQASSEEDPSVHWVYQTLTPIDAEGYAAQ